MTDYKIETNANGEIFVVAVHGLTTAQNMGGPYKNEESAKRRIRDLKRKDAENSLTKSMIDQGLIDIETRSPDEPSCYDPEWTYPPLNEPRILGIVAIGQSNYIGETAVYYEPRQGDVMHLNHKGATEYAKNVAEMVRRINETWPVRPSGVYPHVPKKYYRHQWRV